MYVGVRGLRSVFLVDLRHGGQIPKGLRDVLDLMGWDTIRAGVAYVLDWDDAIDAPVPGTVWDRIETVLRTAGHLGVQFRILTMRRGQKIPIVPPESRLEELLA
jgi:hypothetical protein